MGDLVAVKKEKKEIKTKEEKKVSYFDIEKEWQAYEALLLENIKENEGEILPEIADVMETWEKEFFELLATKTDSTASFLRFVEKRAKYFKDEKDFFSRKQKSLENLGNKIKKFLVGYMSYNERTILEGERFKISLVNNGGLIPIQIREAYVEQFKNESLEVVKDAKDIPERFIDWVPVLNREKVREALEKDEALHFCGLGLRGQHIRIS